MVTMGVAMPPPAHWPSGPAPAGVEVRHGYGCACAAQALGVSTAGVPRTAVCEMTDDAYLQMMVAATNEHLAAKQLGSGDDAVAAYLALGRTAAACESYALTLGVDSDLSELHYRRGELDLARTAAQQVIEAIPPFYAAVTHYLQFGDLRACEASRDIAERTLINLDIEELRLDEAQALIVKQHERNVTRRENEAADPGQFTPSMMIAFDLDDTELEVLRARLSMARGDHAAAAVHLDRAVAALADWQPPPGAALAPGDRDGLLAQARTILAMARAERTRLDLSTGRIEEGHAGLVAGRLRGASGTGADAQLAELSGADQVDQLRALLAEQTAVGQVAEAAETALTLGCALIDVGDPASALAAIDEAERGWQATGQLAAQRPRLALPRAVCLTGLGRQAEALALVRDAADRYAAAGAGYDAVRADVVTALIAVEAGDASLTDVALTAVLGAESLRYTLATAAERDAWDTTAVQPGLGLAIRLLTAADRATELAALLERRAATGAIDIAPAEEPAVASPPASTSAHEVLALAAGAAPLAPTGPRGWRLIPPPEPPELAAAAERARERYRLPTSPAAAAPVGRPAARPTVTVRYVEVEGAIFRVWRSSTHPEQPHMAQIHPATLPSWLAYLAHALPTPLPGEDQAAALARARSGPLADPAGEAQLAAGLGSILLGGDLGHALREATGDRPRLLIQPSAALESVPWPLLGVVGIVADDAPPRAIDVAEVALLAPEGAEAAAAPVPEGSGLLRVIEPAGTGLGRLLRHRVRASDDAVVRTRQEVAYPRGQLLADLQERPESFMYLGHVAAPGAVPGLQLSDGTVTALDLAALPMPSRVALLGCASAQDVARADAASLPRAAISAGAAVVIATPWTLPTAVGLAAAEGEDPLADLSSAVEQVLRAPDPVAACRDLLLAARAAWPQSGPPPLLWGGLTPLVRSQTWDR